MLRCFWTSFPSLQRSVLKAAGTGDSAWLQESAAVRMDGSAVPATPVSLDAHSHAHQRTSVNCLTVVLVCQVVWSALNRRFVPSFWAYRFSRCERPQTWCRFFQVSQMFKRCVLCLGSSCVFSAMPEWRKVHFSQQVPLPPAVLRPPLPGEEEVPLVSPCWGQRLMTPNQKALWGFFYFFF